MDLQTQSGNIVLIGASGSGKTAIGKQLSKLLGLGFIDLDEILEKRLKKSVAAIFKEHGEDYFRSQEAGLLDELTQVRSHVVALGGGAILSQEKWKLAHRIGPIVWIQSSPVEVARRLYRKIDEIEKRPLLQDVLTIENHQERLKAIQSRMKSLLEERRSWYSQADLVLDGSYVTPDLAAQHLKDILLTEGMVRLRRQSYFKVQAGLH